MEYLINPIKNHYVDFEGKVTRKPFWMFMLLSMLISIVITAIGGVIGLPAIGSIFSLAIFLWIILIVFWAQDSK